MKPTLMAFSLPENWGNGAHKKFYRTGNSGSSGVKKRIELSKAKLEGSLDLVIIGAGPAGIGAALKAKELGLNYLVLEQESLGGTVFTYPRAKIVMTHPVDLPLHGPVKLINTNKQELLAMWELLRDQYQLNIKENTKVNTINKRGDGFILEINGEVPSKPAP